jgi:oligosaccharyltransferase complex subunit beta
LVALSPSRPTPASIVSLLLELDIHLPTDKSTLVVDHFNYDYQSASDAHDVLLLPQPAPLRDGVRTFFTIKPDTLIAVPRAVPQTLGNASPLVAPILKAPSTAYSYSEKTDAEALNDEVWGTGSQMSIVTSFQARNSARVTVLGSAEMLEDRWFKAQLQKGPGAPKQHPANRDFVKAVSGWAFQEIGVLRVEKITHYLDEGAEEIVENPKIYRVKNDVVCSTVET